MQRQWHTYPVASRGPGEQLRREAEGQEDEAPTSWPQKLRPLAQPTELGYSLSAQRNPPDFLRVLAATRVLLRPGQTTVSCPNTAENGSTHIRAAGRNGR